MPDRCSLGLPGTENEEKAFKTVTLGNGDGEEFGAPSVGFGRSAGSGTIVRFTVIVMYI